MPPHCGNIGPCWPSPLPVCCHRNWSTPQGSKSLRPTPQEPAPSRYAAPLPCLLLLTRCTVAAAGGSTTDVAPEQGFRPCRRMRHRSETHAAAVACLAPAICDSYQMLLALLRQYVQPYRRLVAVLMVLQLISTLASLYLPTVNAAIIDKGVAKGDTTTI